MNEPAGTNGPTPREDRLDPEDLALLDRARVMWERTDPPPGNLVDNVIAALASENLDLEYELLTLTERTTEMTGARSTVADLAELTRLEFQGGDLTVLLRVAQSGNGRRRIDGWLSPATAGSVRLLQVEHERRADKPSDLETTADDGRFAFAEVDPGLVRIWISAEVGGATTSVATPAFEI